MEEVADDTGLVGPVDLRTGFSVTGDLVAAGLGGAISWGGCLATGALAALPGGIVPLGRRLLVDDVCGVPLACFVAALLTTADAFDGLLITDGDLALAEPAFALGAFSEPAVGGTSAGFFGAVGRTSLGFWNTLGSPDGGFTSVRPAFTAAPSLPAVFPLAG